MNTADLVPNCFLVEYAFPKTTENIKSKYRSVIIALLIIFIYYIRQYSLKFETKECSYKDLSYIYFGTLFHKKKCY